MKRIIFKHVAAWLVLSIIYFFLTETIAKLLFEEFNNVELWLITLFSGLTSIFLLVMISFIFQVVKYTQRTNRGHK